MLTYFEAQKKQNKICRTHNQLHISLYEYLKSALFASFNTFHESNRRKPIFTNSLRKCCKGEFSIKKKICTAKVENESLQIQLFRFCSFSSVEFGLKKNDKRIHERLSREMNINKKFTLSVRFDCIHSSIPPRHFQPYLMSKIKFKQKYEMRNFSWLKILSEEILVPSQKIAEHFFDNKIAVGLRGWKQIDYRGTHHFATFPGSRTGVW